MVANKRSDVKTLLRKNHISFIESKLQLDVFKLIVDIFGQTVLNDIHGNIVNHGCNLVKSKTRTMLTKTMKMHIEKKVRIDFFS